MCMIIIVYHRFPGQATESLIAETPAGMFLLFTSIFQADSNHMCDISLFLQQDERELVQHQTALWLALWRKSFKMVTLF